MTFKKETELLPDEEKYDTLEKYIKWLDERVNSLETFLHGKDIKKESCMECSLRELRSALAHVKHVKSLK